MTDIQKRLFDFMARYYGRTKLENENDYKTMLGLFKEIYPYEIVPENCIGCRDNLLKKLQFHYETLASHGVFG